MAGPTYNLSHYLTVLQPNFVLVKFTNTNPKLNPLVMYNILLFFLLLPPAALRGFLRRALPAALGLRQSSGGTCGGLFYLESRQVSIDSNYQRVGS